MVIHRFAGKFLAIFNFERKREKREKEREAKGQTGIPREMRLQPEFGAPQAKICSKVKIRRVENGRWMENRIGKSLEFEAENHAITSASSRHFCLPCT